jgi:hypothetical protein
MRLLPLISRRAAVLAILLWASAGSLQAGVITGPGGGFRVGIDNFGNLFDPPTLVGFLRTADGYDPIFPGTPRDAWGVSAGTTSGFVDPQSGPPFVTPPGIVNIIPNAALPPVFGLNTASISTLLNAGAGDVLQIDQTYSFAAPNVLRINARLKNLSDTSQAIRFRRLVDWDIDLVNFVTDVSTPPDSTNPTVAATARAAFSPFVSADPATAFAPFDPASVPVGPDDVGGGLDLSLGSLASGASTSFDIFYAINDRGQSEAALRAQLLGLSPSVDFVVTTGNSSDPTNSAAIGVATSDPVTVVPEPGSITLFGMGVLGLLGYGWRRRAAV